MSDSARPHRQQPTRLPHPWDSPGKKTGVGCHCLLQCMKVKSQSEVARLCLTLRSCGLQPTRLLHPWDFPGKSTGVGCHSLLQILYIENPKDTIRKLLELISEFSKVARYKINTQKSLSFLYTNNEKSDREIK